jgi:iron complex outermembrane receptor protein
MVDKSSLWAAQIQHTTPLGDRQRFVYGADVISTNPDTEGTIHGRNEPDDNVWEAGAYAQSETGLSPKWDLVLAARVDWHNKVEDIVFSPRAAIVFKPTPEHNLRVAYNRAFSQPTSINLSLDLLSSPTLGPWTDYGVRALGVPHETGLTFNRSCTGGLCVRSPFNPAGASEWLGLNELDESAYWNAAIDQLIAATGPLDEALEDLLRSLDPSGQLGGVLRTVDLEASPVPFGQIEPVNQAAIDVAPLVPSITNTIELGYKGLLTDKLLVGFDVYWQRVEDFIGPLNFETPNAFYDPRDMAAWLTPILQGAGLDADQITPLVVGLTGMPLATATWNEASDPTDTYLTYRNFGNVDLWGVDLGLTLLLGDKWTVSGAYSLNCGWVSSDSTCVNFFPNLAGIDDVALNAPNNKGMLSVAWRNPRMGLGVEVRGRYVEGYPVSSGVFEGDIPWFMPYDINIAYTLPIATATDLTLTATNVFSCTGDTDLVQGGCGFRDLHQEMIGAPFLGRMVLLRLRQSF